MELKVSSNVLKKALSSLNKVVNKRSTLESLAWVMLDFDKDLKLTAGDGEAFMRLSTELISCDAGSVAVDHKTLFDAVKALPTMPIAFKFENGTATCDYQSGTFSIPYFDAEEYPTVPEIEGEETIVSSTVKLRKAANFIADDELRPVMNGVLFDFANGVFVGSDGHRLYKSEEVIKGEGSVICPPRAVNAIKDLDNFNVKYNDTHILFESEGVEVVSRIIDGRYPNYNSVIPNNHVCFELDREELLQAIKRVNVFSSDASSLVRFSFKDGELTLSSQDPDFRISATEKVRVEGSEEIEIGFKGTFMINTLENISGQLVKIELSDPSRAAILRGEDNDVFLMMPMML